MPIERRQGGFGGWIQFSGFTRMIVTQFTCPDTPANQAIWAAGRRIRFNTNGGAFYYGLVRQVNIALGVITVDFDGMQWGGGATFGLWYSVRNHGPTEAISVPGNFGDASDLNLLLSDLLTEYVSGDELYYYIRMRAKCLVSDSTIDPSINIVSLAGDAFTADIDVNGGGWTNTADTADVGGYVSFGDDIELRVVVTGTGDARDLIVLLDRCYP